MNRILVVEDLEDDLVLMRRALSRSGRTFDLRVARDGQEAVDLLSNQSWLPHLVLLDLKLPKLSGFDVLETVQHTLPTMIKLVVVSSSDEPGDIDKAMSLGAAEYVQKPVAPEEYLSTIGELCRRYLP
ncbi:MAG TPA: response regulator [Fimbriimonadaceae bacterium]|nr:response regulator [Fimbriimonadaceae bacterium]